MITIYKLLSGSNIITRHLPMGAGHCPWGGYTDRNVYMELLGPMILALQTCTN